MIRRVLDFAIRGIIVAVPAVALLCCDPLHAPHRDAESAPAVTTIGCDVDPAICGTIAGRVSCAGPVPAWPPIVIGIPQPDGTSRSRAYPNPNFWQVEPTTHGVAGAVVFLESVELSRSRPWDHPPVRIEMHDEQIRVVQGNAVGQIGIVRRGEEIEMVSRDAAFHLLSVRGAAFFALAFPDPDRPLRRRLDHSGLVELTSGAGKYWHQAYLFVAEHPYFTRTDANGRFVFKQVPAGDYRIRCWLPNGKIVLRDRDPNMGSIIRHHYAPPLERAKPIMVSPRMKSDVDFEMRCE